MKVIGPHGQDHGAGEEWEMGQDHFGSGEECIGALLEFRRQKRDIRATRATIAF